MELFPHVHGGNPQGNPQNFRPRAAGETNPTTDRPVMLNRLSGRPDAKGNEIRLYEKPWMTNAAFMWASGKYSAKAIARACEVSYATVLDLMKNDWFQEKIALIQQEHGAGDIMEQFRSECQNSLVTLIEIRDDPKAPQSVRRASAIDILHQVLGKPTQRVEMDATPRSDDPVAEVARLEQENTRLKDSSPASSSEP